MNDPVFRIMVDRLILSIVMYVVRLISLTVRFTIIDRLIVPGTAVFVFFNVYLLYIVIPGKKLEFLNKMGNIIKKSYFYDFLLYCP